MAKIENTLPLEGNYIDRTSQLINDGEFGVSKFVEEIDLPDLVEDIIDELGLEGDKNYVHMQSVPSTLWVIDHPLNKRVSVTVVDSAGTVYEGRVIINDGNRVTIQFNIPFWGYAYLN